jgi:Pyridoxamine 5'-phosphate oxidase like
MVSRGPEDPNLGLLRVDVENGEYWDPVASKLVQFFAMAKAAVTRTPPQNIGEHRRFSN